MSRPTLDADVLILGGGCAGLSLAVALAEYAPRLRVITLEQRGSYVRDRTWCFWSGTGHPFSAAITKTWNAWRLQTGNRQTVQRSRNYSYQHLPADRFYMLAQDKLAAAGQQLMLGTAVLGFEAQRELCEVKTDRGLLRARWLFDARTPAPGKAAPVLWQRFRGWHVRMEQPCFDPEIVDLMNFQPVSLPGRTVFFYVLPFSPHEALVEVTYLDIACLPSEDGREPLLHKLEQMCPGGRWEVLYEEAGALPMGMQQAPRPASSHVCNLGTRGGRVKPSSGYAFQRIQRQSMALARALAAGHALPLRYEPRMYRLLDRVFLAALQQKPQSTAEYFFRLFQSVPPDTLVPFLSETASMRAVASTVLALPKWDFLQAALLHAWGVA